MRKALFLLAIALFSLGTYAQNTTQGTLYAVDKKGRDLGACPLKNTAVRANITGFLARVNVKQEFENSFSEPIEAVYTFPLSQNGAVDDMTMTIGSRIIRGKIMKRLEARQVYENAKAAGQAASLLDQERPNIFTQAVANIMPGEKVVIEISYVETLKYEEGAYEFVFPMTVGPRYVPASVADANKIKPPVVESTRAGHDISIEINLNAGVPVEAVRSDSHRIEQVNFAPSKAKVTLQGEKTIPNKDFILRYDVTGKRLEDGVLAHRGKRGGFFTLVLQPPDFVAPEDRTPKEIVFVLDTSGSMSGFPIEKAKEAMRLSLDGLYPEDTFNLITFAGDTHVLFEEPVPATQANLELARAFLESRQGSGGTEMMKAIKASLDPSDSKEHLRIVCFMTDGFVGNEDQIVAEIKRHTMARVFSFGIGSSVNRSLLDRMAAAGRGEVEYVGLNDDGSKAAKRFYERIRTPMLTDLSIDWNGLPVTHVNPGELGDLFSAKPVIVHGRYTKAATGSIKLKGKVAGQPYERMIDVTLPEADPVNDVLATLWARRRVEELSMEALKGGSRAEMANKEIEALGLDFSLMTAFTSFVAVEEQVVNRGGTPTRIEVPVAIPEGVNLRMAAGSNAAVQIDGADISSNAVTVSSSIAGRQITNLPVQSRSALDMVTLLPGTTAPKGWGDPNSKSSPTGPVTAAKSAPPSVAMGTGTGRGSGSGSGAGWAPPPPSKDATFRTLEAIASLQRPPAATSGGVLNGKATSLPKPQYPAAASAVRASGAVSVYVTVDESGNVVAAEAVSGHPLLRPAAVQAAKQAKFTPTMLSGQPVKTMGIVTYNFAGPESDVTATAGDRVIQGGGAPPTAEMVREWKIKAKSHAWVFSVIDRLRRNDWTPGPNEGAFVLSGLASIQVTLTERSQPIIDRLRELGFEVGAEKGATSLSGRIPIEKLAELAEMEEVKLVMPGSR